MNSAAGRKLMSTRSHANCSACCIWLWRLWRHRLGEACELGHGYPESGSGVTHVCSKATIAVGEYYTLPHQMPATTEPNGFLPPCEARFFANHFLSSSLFLVVKRTRAPHLLQGTAWHGSQDIERGNAVSQSKKWIVSWLSAQRS